MAPEKCVYMDDLKLLFTQQAVAQLARKNKTLQVKKISFGQNCNFFVLLGQGKKSTHLSSVKCKILMKTVLPFWKRKLALEQTFNGFGPPQAKPNQRRIQGRVYGG